MFDLIQNFLTLLVTPHGDAILAIPPLILAALIGAGAGAVNNRSKQQAADAERKYQAETARWSPWTGMTSKNVQDPSMTSDVLGGAVSGLSFGMANPGMMGGGGNAAGAAGAGAAGATGPGGSMGAMGPVASGDVYGGSLNDVYGYQGDLYKPQGQRSSSYMAMYKPQRPY